MQKNNGKISHKKQLLQGQKQTKASNWDESLQVSNQEAFFDGKNSITLIVFDFYLLKLLLS
jgi:hypothetical protein